MTKGVLAIVPTYNEAGNIGLLVDGIFNAVPDASVMVVDDGSPDGTANVVRGLMAGRPGLMLYERTAKEGLGAAYVAAFKKALTEHDPALIITMDGDLSHDPAHLPAMLSAAQSNDLVIGSRYVVGGGIAKWEFWRRQLSAWANRYVRTILGLPIMDWTSGFQCIRASALRRIDLSAIDLSGYAFLQELKYALAVAGATFAEVPITFQARREGESKISGFIIREGILGPWKMRFKNRR
jgi:dolichol-phosphate mannosyltransferase